MNTEDPKGLTILITLILERPLSIEELTKHKKQITPWGVG